MQWTLLLIHLILPPFHWRMSNLKGLREPGYGHGLPSAPWRQHIAQLQEASFPGRHQSGSPPSPDCVTGLGGATKAPVHFVPRMGPMFKPLPGQCACFLKNLVPPVTAWVLFYFLLPDLWQGAYWKFLSTQMSSSHNSILEKSHFVFLRKHLACLIVLSTWKETVWRRTVKNVKMRFRLLTRVPSRLY